MPIGYSNATAVASSFSSANKNSGLGFGNNVVVVDGVACITDGEDIKPISSSDKLAIGNNKLCKSKGYKADAMESGFTLYGASFGASTGNSSTKTITNPIDGSSAQLLSVPPGQDLYLLKTLNNTLKNMDTAELFGFWIYIGDQDTYNATVLDNQGGSVGVYADLSHNDFAHLRTNGQTRQNLSPDVSSNLLIGWNFVSLTVGAQASGKEYVDNTVLTPWSTPQTGFGFRVLNGSTKTLKIAFGSPVINAKSKPTLVWTMDDGVDNQYTIAYGKLSQLGWRAGISVIPSNLGQPGGWCTLAQIKEMHDVGKWDMMNHTYNHVNLTTISTVDGVDRELSLWERWAANNGITQGADIFVYPQGGFNSVSIDGVYKAGYTKGRGTIQKSFNVAYGVDKIMVPSYILGFPTTLATVQGLIDSTIARSEVFILYMHELVASPANGNQWAISDFYALADYVKTKEDAGLIQVLSPSEFFASLPS